MKYGNTKITQHALKHSVSLQTRVLKLDTIVIVYIRKKKKKFLYEGTKQHTAESSTGGATPG